MASPAAVPDTPEVGITSLSGGASGSCDLFAALASVPDSNLSEQIQKLKMEQQAAKLLRKRLAREVKNAEKKRRRLKSKASLLTDEDLVAVLRLRQQAKQDSSSRLQAAQSGAMGGADGRGKACSKGDGTTAAARAHESASEEELGSEKECDERTD